MAITLQDIAARLEILERDYENVLRRGTIITGYHGASSILCGVVSDWAWDKMREIANEIQRIKELEKSLLTNDKEKTK